jgi:hypothetical protein
MIRSVIRFVKNFHDVLFFLGLIVNVLVQVFNSPLHRLRLPADRIVVNMAPAALETAADDDGEDYDPSDSVAQ